ncbi:hypothetical protein B0H66DRAFT_607162 [Apodospora peruviana]|uniref:C2H2-type domain-containing protein n=1 Tax=Apodospora peruviana TaxID=516989 RepID=A0AAE0M021_9PEZI|nr:hypothetical protein B0H66DRAFT_607162 [Apodospora peruviana]
MGIQSKRTKTKTRRYTRDVDQSKSDLLSPRHLQQFKDTKSPEDLPGLGRHYCVQCSRWFDTEFSLTTHNKGKPHKRRVKDLLNPYTHKEADAAGGLTWTDNGPSSKTKAQDMELDMTS